jgi:hypothetical protein
VFLSSTYHCRMKISRSFSAPTLPSSWCASSFFLFFLSRLFSMDSCLFSGLQEGELQKKSPRGLFKVWQTRYFKLTDTALLVPLSLSLSLSPSFSINRFPSCSITKRAKTKKPPAPFSCLRSRSSQRRRAASRGSSWSPAKTLSAALILSLQPPDQKEMCVSPLSYLFVSSSPAFFSRRLSLSPSFLRNGSRTSKTS